MMLINYRKVGLSLFVLALLLGLSLPVTQATGLANMVSAFGTCSSAQVSINVIGGGPFTFKITSSAGLNTTVTANLLNGAGQIVTLNFPEQPSGSTITISRQSLNLNNVSFSYACVGGDAAEAVLDPFGDVDGDGIINRDDNCVRVKNPDQADGWGSFLGDACDTDNYDSSDGVKAFPQKNGNFKVFGNCQESRCALIAEITSSDLATILTFPDFRRFSTEDGGGWYVDVYFLGTDQNGNKVYQVNVYNALGQLQDDNLLLIVAPDGKTSYRVR